MRLRHKQPTLVSMWMLDVFCCALGCVILLLLLKMREASFAAEEVRTTDTHLKDAEGNLIESEYRNFLLGAEIIERDGQLTLLQKDRDELAKNLALVRNERDESARQLALVREQKDELAKKLAVVEEAVRLTEAELALARKKIDADAKALALVKEKSALTDVELAKRSAEVAELAKKMAASEKDRETVAAQLLEKQKDRDALAMLVREKEKTRADALRQALDLTDRLSLAESKLKSSEKLIDDLMAKTTDIAKASARIAELEKKVADSNVTIVDLQGTKAKLADKINKLEIENDQRFAGIAMTGKNVVFLIDISGSMIRLDENTLDPQKWPIVRDTLVKVMRSLPDLEQFQVILFSNKLSYLLGNDGNWISCGKQSSEKERAIERVHKAMTEVKPNGDTNVHLGLSEAFKFRRKDLDTIYFFSDGLPTSGPGLTAAEEAANLSDNDRAVILTRYLRRILKTDWNKIDPRQPRVRINSIGFFYESPDVGAFLWALSRENDGSFVGMSRP